MALTLTIENNVINVKSDYNKDFISKARTLGGKWNSPYWCFDARDEKAVRELCLNVYGTDGSPTKTVDVRITIPAQVSAHNSSIIMLGRIVATAFGRDSGAKLGDGIIIESGGFTSGGSMKNWNTKSHDSETVFIMRDVYLPIVDGVNSIKYDNETISLEIISENTESMDELQAERARLIKLVEAIEAKIDAL